MREILSILFAIVISVAVMIALIVVVSKALGTY